MNTSTTERVGDVDVPHDDWWLMIDGGFFRRLTCERICRIVTRDYQYSTWYLITKLILQRWSLAGSSLLLLLLRRLQGTTVIVIENYNAVMLAIVAMSAGVSVVMSIFIRLMWPACNCCGWSEVRLGPSGLELRQHDVIPVESPSQWNVRLARDDVRYVQFCTVVRTVL